MPIEDGELRIKQKWHVEWPKVKGRMAGFMKSQGGKILHEIPKEGSKQRGRAWPSPRTWVFAARAMTGGAVAGEHLGAPGECGAGRGCA